MQTDREAQDDTDLAAGNLTCKCAVEYCPVHHEIGDDATTPQRCSAVAVAFLHQPSGDCRVPLCEECVAPWRGKPLKGPIPQASHGPAGQWAADKKTRRQIWKRWAWCGTHNPHSWANLWSLYQERAHVRSDINDLLEIIDRLQRRIDARSD